MAQRQIDTSDGTITVTAEGAHTEVTYIYSLSGAPRMAARGPGRPRFFQPDAAEVHVDDGESDHITLIGARVPASGRPAKPSQRSVVVYQQYLAPWDDLPEWAEPLVHMHGSILEYQLIRPAGMDGPST